MDDAMVQWSESEWIGWAIIAALIALPVILFINWRRSGSDPISQTRADWYGSMFKSLGLVIVGSVLTAATYSSAASSGGGAYVVFWGMIALGGLSFLWRAARYFFRVKPQLDLLEQMQTASVLPQVAMPVPARAPASPRRGFRYWLKVAAIVWIGLSVAARVAYNTRDTSQYRIATSTAAGFTGFISETPPPVKIPTPKPGATRPAPADQPLAWGYRDTFDDAVQVATTSTDAVTTAVRNGRYVITVHQPDQYWTEVWPTGTGGQDARILINVASTRGEGSIALYVEAEDGSYRWGYLVDPGAREWRVDRYSFEGGGFFPWVEPRSFDTMHFGPLQTLELRIVSGQPYLLVNGLSVASIARVQLEQTPGSVLLGFGAYGAGISVEFDVVEVSLV